MLAYRRRELGFTSTQIHRITSFSSAMLDRIYEQLGTVNADTGNGLPSGRSHETCLPLLLAIASALHFSGSRSCRLAAAFRAGDTGSPIAELGKLAKFLLLQYRVTVMNRTA